MKTYTEKAREIPVAAEVDVLVAGGGPAGFAAAYTAAKNGVSVLLLEQGGDVGGMSTIGLMSHWVGRADSKLYHEILRRSADRNPGAYQGVQTRLINTEELKTLYLEMLEEVHARLMLYTFVSDVITDNGAVTGLIVENKAGRQAILANTVVDATGDGDVAARAGAEFQLGREDDQKMQPMTLMFKVGGVDVENAALPGSFESLVETEKGELQALAKQLLPHPAGHVLLYENVLPGIVTVNMTNVTGADGTDSGDLTKATVVCRKQIEKIVEFLREFVPGFENCFLITSASFMGVRETRHFEGVARLTEQDILEARQFPDWVVKDAHFNFDVHNISGSGLDETGAQKHFSQQKGYDIPIGCLIPKHIDGLVLSGRNISGTHMAHSNFRVMPICVGTGAAAGAIAAIAAKSGQKPRDVQAADVQAVLLG